MTGGSPAISWRDVSAPLMPGRSDHGAGTCETIRFLDAAIAGHRWRKGKVRAARTDTSAVDQQIGHRRS